MHYIYYILLDHSHARTKISIGSSQRKTISLAPNKEGRLLMPGNFFVRYIFGEKYFKSLNDTHKYKFFLNK